MRRSRDDGPEYTAVEVDLIEAETPAAVLIRPKDSDRTVWVPRSLLEDDDFEKGDRDVELNVKTWFCKREGLE